MQSSMFTIVRDTLRYIANTTEYDYDVMEDRMKEYLHNCGKCSATTKSGQMCAYNVVAGSLHCRRHTAKENSSRATSQCEALNQNGTRCIKDAKRNHTLCGVHIGMLERRERNKDVRGCVFYQDDEENDFQFCKHPAISGQWCCRSHEHLNSLYSRTYGCESMREYETVPTIKRNIVLEKMLKKSED